MSFRLLLVASFSAVVARASPAFVGRFWAASFWACLMVDWAELTSLVIASMPFEAAWMVWTAFDWPSRSDVSWLARPLSAEAVKKLTGLSTAEFTRLPVASLFWMPWACEAVDWSAPRAVRTPVESAIAM